MGIERTWIKRDIKNKQLLNISDIEWQKAKEAVGEFIRKTKKKPPFKFSRKELAKIYPELAQEFHHSFIVVSDKKHGFKLAAKARSKAYHKVNKDQSTERVEEGILGHGNLRVVTPIQWEDNTQDVVIIQKQSTESVKEKSIDLEILNALERSRGQQFVRERPEETAWIGGSKIKNKIYTPQELIEGVDLETYLESNKKMDPMKKYEIARQCAKAIFDLHQNNFIHCDVKPENFMLQENGNVLVSKAVDFDFSKKLKGGKMEVQGKTLEGTPIYMAPEIAVIKEGNYGKLQILSKEKRYSTAADIYSLGIMFARDLKIAALDSPFRPLIEKMLQDDPKQRPKMTEVMATLVNPENYEKYRNLYAHLDKYREDKLKKDQTTLSAFKSFGMNAKDQIKMVAKLEDILKNYRNDIKNPEETSLEILSLLKENQDRHDKTIFHATSPFNLKTLQALPKELQDPILEKLGIAKNSSILTKNSSNNRKLLTTRMKAYDPREKMPKVGSDRRGDTTNLPSSPKV